MDHAKWLKKAMWQDHAIDEAIYKADEEMTINRIREHYQEKYSKIKPEDNLFMEESKKVYCNDCKFVNHFGILQTECVMPTGEYKDTPLERKEILETFNVYEKNKNNDCADFEKRNTYEKEEILPR
jgi:hypothetical protein